MEFVVNVLQIDALADRGVVFDFHGRFDVTPAEHGQTVLRFTGPALNQLLDALRKRQGGTSGPPGTVQ